MLRIILILHNILLSNINTQPLTVLCIKGLFAKNLLTPTTTLNTVMAAGNITSVQYCSQTESPSLTEQKSLIFSPTAIKYILRNYTRCSYGIYFRKLSSYNVQSQADNYLHKHPIRRKDNNFCPLFSVIIYQRLLSCHVILQEAFIL